MPDPSTAARVPLRGTVVTLGGAIDTTSRAHDAVVPRPPDGVPPGTATSCERLARTGERETWVAEDASRAELARDVETYARVLPDGGMTARQTLTAVANVVREAAGPSLGPGSLDALVHDAGRCCVEAYFAA
jgi:hypothetical protein